MLSSCRRGYTAAMECSTYDLLRREWRVASAAEDEALAAQSPALAHLTDDEFCAHRTRTRLDLQRMEDRLDAHLDHCTVCQAEGREKFRQPAFAGEYST